MRNFLLIAFSLFVNLSLSAQISDSLQREIHLQGTVNFRDAGGYKTTNGKQVKWGKMYRSGSLNKLTNADIEILSKLKLAKDIDFRGPYEIKTAPDRMPNHVAYINLPAGSEKIGDSLYLKTLLQSMKKDEGILEMYQNLTPFKDRYAPLFKELLALPADSALLFHCSAGKDRTGIAAALILSALGVDKKTIIEDYLSTNYYRRNENVMAIKGMVAMYKLDEEVAKNLMAAKESYIQATFNSIENQYGSIENFLIKGIGLSKKDIKQLRKKFLE